MQEDNRVLRNDGDPAPQLAKAQLGDVHLRDCLLFNQFNQH